MSSEKTSEETFEWIETPPAPSPVTPKFDCGVKVTSVCLSSPHCWQSYLQDAPPAIEPLNGETGC